MLKRQPFQLAIGFLLAQDQLLTLVDQAAQFGDHRILRSTEGLLDFGFNPVPEKRPGARTYPTAEMLQLPAKKVHCRYPISDQPPPDRQARLKGLALKGLQMNPRDRAGAKSARLRDTARVTRIRLVSAHPQEFAKLTRLIHVHRVTEVAQAASKAHSNSGFKAYSCEPSASEKGDFATNGFDVGGAVSFVDDCARVVDDAHAGRFDAHVKTRPIFPCHLDSLSSHGGSAPIRSTGWRAALT
jgi:hypothetical protein